MTLYLDIETSYDGDISVIGLYDRSIGLCQLVGPDISADLLLDALPDSRHLVTFNGHCFDLPVIRKQLGVDLSERFQSIDLRYACRRVGLVGGLKQIEKKVGIERKLEGVSGRDAPRLWYFYRFEDDPRALELLLQYNRDDVMNLRRLRMIVRKLAALQD